MSLRYRIAVMVFLLEAVMVFVVLSVTLRQSTEASSNLINSADVRLLAMVESPAREALLTEEYAAFQAYIEKAVTDPHVAGVVLLGSKEQYLAGTDKALRPGLSSAPANSGEDVAGEHWLWQSIDGASGHLGRVGIRFSKQALNAEITKARNTGLLLALAGMSLIAFAGVAIGYLLTRRLDRLAQAAERFAAGEVDARSRLGGRDEIGRLGRVFDDMADKVGATLQALRDSERRNRLLVEGGPAATFVFDVDDFCLVDVNQKMVELLKYPKEKLIGMTPMEASPPLQKAGQKTDELAGELIRRTFSGEQPTAEWILRDSTGRDIPCELQLSIYPDEVRRRIIGIIYDVSERARIRTALERRMQFEDMIVRMSARLAGLKSEQIDIGIHDLLAEIGKFAGVDRSYLFEFSQDMHHESCAQEWCAPGIEPAIDRLQNLPLADFPWFVARIGRGEVLHVPRVSELPVEASAEKAEFEAEGIRSVIMVPLVFEDQVGGYMGFDAVRQEVEWPPEIVVMLRIAGEMVFNALHRKRSESSIREKTQALEKANAALESSNEELQQFAYVASHDLREPLRAISGFSGLLVDRYKDKLDEDAKEFIGFITDATKRMDNMIRDLLAYARVDTQAEPPAPCDMGQLLVQAQSNLLAIITERQARITHDELPTVQADATQVVQLLQNLIANAIKFCSESVPQVHVGAKHQEGQWVFSVRDNGIGIDPKQASSVFQIFKRLNPGDRYSGTGIGLAVCKRIVERRGGRIWVERNTGPGSTFYFTLQAAA